MTRSAWTKFTATTITIAAVLFLTLVESCGYASSAFVGGLILAPGVGFFLLVWGWVRRRPRTRAFGAALMLGAVLGVAASMIVMDWQVAASKARGDRLGIALEKCREVTGSYPERLADLVPAFVPQLPCSCTSLFSGRPFSYSRTRDGLDYRLGFASHGVIVCERNRGGGWDCGD